MKILLTGSEGYIGKNFRINNFLHGHDITYCDKKISDVNDPPFNVLDIDNLNVDCIVHLAAISGIKNCEENYDQTIEDNILTTIHLLKFYIPIVFASSQSAKEPNNTYAFTKRVCETLIQKSGVPYSILRFANVYGGHDYLKDKTSVVANFLNAERKGEPLIVHGNGEQTRDFIHVEDVCEAIYSSLNPINDIIDIGTGKETRIIDLAKMVSNNILKKPIKNIAGVESNVADIIKSKKLIGFQHSIALKNYIELEFSNMKKE